MALRHTTLLAYVLFPSSQASHLTASRWAWHHLVQLEIQLISLIKYHFKQINQTELNQITFLFKEQATFAESGQHILFWHRINAQIELAASTSLSVLFDCEMYHPFSLMPPSPWKWVTGQEDCCVLIVVAVAFGVSDLLLNSDSKFMSTCQIPTNLLLCVTLQSHVL